MQNINCNFISNLKKDDLNACSKGLSEFEKSQSSQMRGKSLTQQSYHQPLHINRSAS